MNLTLIKAMYCGNFFSTDSQFKNHKLVNIISLDDVAKTAHVVLQRYSIGSDATVSTNSNSIFNQVISYDEFKKVCR